MNSRNSFESHLRSLSLMVYIILKMYIILRLVMPLFCIIYTADAQQFIDFPVGAPVTPSPTPLLIQDEKEVFLGMTGADPKE